MKTFQRSSLCCNCLLSSLNLLTRQQWSKSRIWLQMLDSLRCARMNSNGQTQWSYHQQPRVLHPQHASTWFQCCCWLHWRTPLHWSDLLLNLHCCIFYCNRFHLLLSTHRYHLDICVDCTRGHTIRPIEIHQEAVRLAKTNGTGNQKNFLNPKIHNSNYWSPKDQCHPLSTTWWPCVECSNNLHAPNTDLGTQDVGNFFQHTLQNMCIAPNPDHRCHDHCIPLEHVLRSLRSEWNSTKDPRDKSANCTREIWNLKCRSQIHNHRNMCIVWWHWKNYRVNCRNLTNQCFVQWMLERGQRTREEGGSAWCLLSRWWERRWRRRFEVQNNCDKRVKSVIDGGWWAKRLTSLIGSLINCCSELTLATDAPAILLFNRSTDSYCLYYLIDRLITLWRHCETNGALSEYWDTQYLSIYLSVGPCPSILLFGSEHKGEFNRTLQPWFTFSM